MQDKTMFCFMCGCEYANNIKDNIFECGNCKSIFSYDDFLKWKEENGMCKDKL